MNRKAWIIGFAIAFLLALAITAVAPAQGHTDEQLDAWVEDWSWSLWAQGGITNDLFQERWAMSERHPCYFWDRCPAPASETAEWPPPVAHTHPLGVTQAQTPVPISVPNVGGVEQWRTLVAAYFRAADVELALRIMGCESGGKPAAKNPNSSATGLFQHLGKYWASRSAAAGWGGFDRTHPEANIAVAAWLRDQKGGWLHWRACL